MDPSNALILCEHSTALAYLESMLVMITPEHAMLFDYILHCALNVVGTSREGRSAFMDHSIIDYLFIKIDLFLSSPLYETIAGDMLSLCANLQICTPPLNFKDTEILFRKSCQLYKQYPTDENAYEMAWSMKYLVSGSDHLEQRANLLGNCGLIKEMIRFLSPKKSWRPTQVILNVLCHIADQGSLFLFDTEVVKVLNAIVSQGRDDFQKSNMQCELKCSSASFGGALRVIANLAKDDYNQHPFVKQLANEMQLYTGLMNKKSEEVGVLAIRVVYNLFDSLRGAPGEEKTLEHYYVTHGHVSDGNAGNHEKVFRQS